MDARRMAARLPCSPAFRGSRSATRRCPAARSPATRRSAAVCWCRSRSPLRGAAGARHRRACRAARAAHALRRGGCDRGVVRRRRDALRASTGPRPPARRSPCRWCRATSSQDASSIPRYRERHLPALRALAEQSRGRLIVLPESALPVFARRGARRRAASASAARPTRATATCCSACSRCRAPRARRRRRATTTASSASARHAADLPQASPGAVRRDDSAEAGVRLADPRVLSIPLADQAPGPADQPPLEVAGQKVAVDICYEDAFGDELRRGARDATLLVNVTNDAWYGHSIAAEQHNQIAAMRALETGGRCCARPTPASRRRSAPTAASRAACRGSRAASSRSASPGARARRRTCASATRCRSAFAAVLLAAALMARRRAVTAGARG